LPVEATNVGGVISATTVEFAGPGCPVPGALVVLPLNGPITVTVQPGCTRTISILFNPIAAGPTDLQMFDDDPFFDDPMEIITAISAGPPVVHGFFYNLECDADNKIIGKGFIVVYESGEQTAEIYFKDGTKFIPDDIMTGAQLFWTFQCAKTITNAVDKIIGDIINLAWAGDFLILEVPPNTLVDDTIITLSNPFPIPNPTGVPSGFLPISEAVSIEPFDTELLLAVLVDMPYTDGEIKGYDEANLVVMEFDPTFNDWNAISSFVEVNENVLLFDPVNFGIYGFTSIPAAPACDDGVDTDGDGVPDGCDSCPQDNPDDRDGDGICQSDDPCPDDQLNQCTVPPVVDGTVTKTCTPNTPVLVTSMACQRLGTSLFNS